MNAVILYSSRHGTTYSIANHIALACDADIATLNEFDTGTLANYDTVILGAPLYSGKIPSEMELFCRNYLTELLEKKLGLFISGLKTTRYKRQRELTTAFLKPLFKHASATVFVGGAINSTKLSKVEKLIARLTLKTRHDTTNIDQSSIEQLISAMKQ